MGRGENCVIRVPGNPHSLYPVGVARLIKVGSWQLAVGYYLSYPELRILIRYALPTANFLFNPSFFAPLRLCEKQKISRKDAKTPRRINLGPDERCGAGWGDVHHGYRGLRGEDTEFVTQPLKLPATE